MHYYKNLQNVKMTKCQNHKMSKSQNVKFLKKFGEAYMSCAENIKSFLIECVLICITSSS